MKIQIAFFLIILLSFMSCDKSNTENPPVVDDPDPDPVVNTTDTLRFASFNVSMFGNTSTELLSQVNNDDDVRFKRVAEIIQRVNPDFLALMEFDYYENNEALEAFVNNYLAVSQNEAGAIDFPYMYAVPSNTGVLSPVDFDGNGSINLPNDAFGFGNFPGQYAFAMLSKYPLKTEEARTFQTYLWKDKEDATLPVYSNGSAYYSDEALTEFRLSSKNHIDMPVEIREGKIIHALLCHPTPPVFDGNEDRNGLRNRDEIGLWVDYINDKDLTDDNGEVGGLDADQSFVIMGDLNADPLKGDSAEGAITQLLDNPRVNQDVSNGTLIPQSNGGAEKGGGIESQTNTSFFGLRVDYALPSNDLEAMRTGVYWPAISEEHSELTNNEASSDHLLVWVDFIMK